MQVSEALATRNGSDAGPAAEPGPVLAALAAAFRHVTIGMAVATPDGRLIDANPAYARMLGYERDELLARGFESVTHPDEEAIDREQWQRLAAGEMESYQREKRYLRKDGSVLWGHVTVSALRDEQGAFAGGFGHVQDITAQKIAETALREQEAQIEALVSQLPVALYSLEPGATAAFQYVSPRFTQLTGLGRDDLPTTFATLLERVHPDDREAVRAADEHATRTGEAAQIEFRIRGGNDEWIWVDNRSVLTRDERGRPRVWHGVLLDVSEQKRLEASLRESEAHLRTIVEQLPAAIYRLEPGPSGRYTYTSPCFTALTGLTLDFHGGDLEVYLTRVHPDDVETVRQGDAEAGRTGLPLHLEYRLRSHDGAWIWVHDRSTLTRDERGDPLAWHGVLLDISDKKRLEAALRASEARFRSIFEGAGIGMALSVPEGTILVANPALEHLLGYASGELEGVRIVDITYPEDLELQTEHLQRMRCGELDAYQFEKRFVRKDGGIVWGLLNASAVKDERGMIQAVIGQVQDITARKEAEAALRKSEARFRALVQNDPDVTVVVDEAMQVIYMSPSAEPVAGIPVAEMLGPMETSLQFVHSENHERVLALFDEVDGQPRAVASVEARIKHAELGWRWYQITIMNLLEDPSVRGYLCNLRDITESKLAELASEAALQAQEEAISELERLNQSKSRFLSTISHEFRTPLTAIIGYSELLAGNGSDPAVAGDAAVIHREASRLNRLVDDVLLVDRMDDGQMSVRMTSVDCNTLVEDVVETFRPLTNRHQFSLDLDPSLLPVVGDRDRLSQALTNLVSNAVKYSPAGGAVTIVTRTDGDDVAILVRVEGIGKARDD
ncbi:MAG: PAS domain S-box protein, partial [Chloroflexi bacterium]|nr:PAS domain S-box protein [Chloroflexota bacterium]